MALFKLATTALLFKNKYDPLLGSSSDPIALYSTGCDCFSSIVAFSDDCPVLPLQPGFSDFGMVRDPLSEAGGVPRCFTC